MKLLFSIFLLLSFLHAHSQFKFELRGTVPPLLNNKKLILVVWDVYSGNQFERKDTVLIKNNSFSFNGILNKPSEDAYLLLNDDRSSYFFVIDSGKNNLIVHEIPANSITKKNKLSAAEMMHSKSNILDKKLDRLVYEDYLEQQKTNTKSDSLDAIRLKKLRLKEFELIKQFPDTYYSLIKLYKLSNTRAITLPELLAFFNTMPNSIKDSPFGKELNERLLNYYTLEAGNTMKSFSATTPTGLAFSNNVLKDTTYLLAFGATWCGPCKENTPMLKELYHKFRDKNFRILCVNLDGNEQLWKKQIKSYGMDWINISDNSKWLKSDLVKAFNISAIPLYFVVDQNQKIVYNSRSRILGNSGPEKMEAVITQLLK